MRRWLRCSAAVAGVVATSAVAHPLCDSADAYKKFYAEIDTYRDALSEKRYADLDSKLNAILDDAQSGRITDLEAEIWFSKLFGRARVGDEPLHKEWIAAYPKSRAAVLAAAIDYQQRGIATRTTEFADKVSEAQFDAMRAEYEKSYPLLARVDAMGRPLSITEGLRIDMRTHAGEMSFPAFEAAIRAALKSFPNSLWLRNIWVYKSAPKWGGSLEKVVAVESSIGSLAPSDQRFIRYRIAMVAGGAFENADQYEEAARLYERAVALCPGLPDALKRVLWMYEKAKNYPALIRAADAYIARYPDDGWAYVKRGWARSQTRDYEPSLRDYEKAASLGNATGSSGVAWFYETGHVVKADRQRAIELYEEAARRGDRKGRENAERLKAKAAEQRK